MSFEMKYDREGRPLKNQAVESEIVAAIGSSVEQPRQLHPELQIRADEPVRDELSQLTPTVEKMDAVTDNLSTTEQDSSRDEVSQVQEPVEDRKSVV